MKLPNYLKVFLIAKCRNLIRIVNEVFTPKEMIFFEIHKNFIYLLFKFYLGIQSRKELLILSSALFNILIADFEFQMTIWNIC